ncbi:MAG: hypothetical protein FD133_176 [Erysipelotrichaceae bacterium]|nr:MAG: hypothetical protein FD179_1167 [Erysipelotrichaceae bacterium]TXT19825.1 MAG: hypothetical protein FD133_176 [Erysipelotrichaceae bacterium]
MNKIYLNLPVINARKSVAFYTELGFVENIEFASHNTACVILGDITVMLLEHDRFKDFTSLRIIDPTREVQAMFAFTVDSRAEVDRITKIALSLGAIEPTPIEDYSYMYARSFTDPDGHAWGPFYYDEQALLKA